jgi:ABC-type multidrug transport system permease subunit
MESPIEFRKAWALVLRDIYNWSSYKSQMVTTVFGAIIGIASWGLLGSYNTALVPQYNTTYLSFLVSGILISNIILPISSGLSSRLSPWSIETVLMTGISAPTYVLGTISWAYALALIFTAPQLLVSVYVFHLSLSVNFLSFVVAFLISSTIMFSLGMISTGVRLVTKVTDPFTWFLGIAASLFAGMTFPIQHLNSYYPGLSNVSWFIPQTWIYNALRLSILDDSSLTDPSVAWAFLGAAAVGLILAPLGIYVFRWGLQRAKKEGSIGFF